MYALSRITASTWGATMEKARQVYLAVVRPAISCGAVVWHWPGEKRQEGPATKLQKHQNSELRHVLGAFRATPIRQLETEAYVPPLDLWLNGRIARFPARLEWTGLARQIRDACTTIRTQLRIRRGQKTAGQLSRLYVQEQTLGAARQSLKTHHRTGQCSSSTLDSERAESSVLVQARTGRVGLAKFLYSRKVPGKLPAECRCEAGEATPRHMVLFCTEEAERRQRLRTGTGGRVDYQQLVGTKSGAKRLAG